MKYYFWLIYDFKCRGSFFFLFFNRRCRVIYIYIYSFFRASIFFQRDRSFALRSKQKQNGDTRISNRMGIDRSRSTGDEHWETRKRCEFFFDRDTSRTCRGTVINLLNGRPVRMNPRALAFNCFEIQIPRFSSGGGGRGGGGGGGGASDVRKWNRCWVFRAMSLQLRSLSPLPRLQSTVLVQFSQTLPFFFCPPPVPAK